MKKRVLGHIKNKVQILYPNVDFNVDDLEEPAEEFGDYASNIAMKLSKILKKSPMDIANEVAKSINSDNLGFKMAVAGPGFLNIKIDDDILIELVNTEITLPQPYMNKKIVVEYSDPNPFKPLHAGHLYTTLVGDVISRIVERAGGQVVRINYGGDVGLHVGKSMWAILRNLGGENYNELMNITDENRSIWLGDRYVEGTKAYDEDPQAKSEIIEVNKRVYQIHEDGDKESDFAKIYWKCREWSYEYFEDLYEKLGVIKFDRFIPESEVTPLAKKIINDQPAVYVKSDNAIIYKGEQDGLHTRVFINSEGLPTYEAKDVGLIFTKWNDYSFDQSIVITANEQEEYMKVVLASVNKFSPELVNRTKHLTHGLVKLAGGVKMSSRMGNILTANDVLEASKAVYKEVNGEENDDISIGAIKYSFARQRIGGDIVYDAKQSVSMLGDSGPYLQYAHVRAKSILRKVERSVGHNEQNQQKDLEQFERSLCRKLVYFDEIFEKSALDLSPHLVANYVYELAKTFNKFYENSPVLNNERSELRISIVKKYTSILTESLNLLGLKELETM